MSNNSTIKSNLIQIALICTSSKFSLIPSLSRGQLVSLIFFGARAKLSFKIQNLFRAKPSQARIFDSVSEPSQPSPAQAFWLEPARFTLIQRTWFSVHCTWYIIKCTLHNAHCTAYIVQRKAYSVHYSCTCTVEPRGLSAH